MPEPQQATSLGFETFQGFVSWTEAQLLLSQHLFLSATEYDDVLISGIGSGKTAIFCARAALLSALNPDNAGLIGRDTETNLIGSTQKDFFEICPEDLLLPGTREGKNGRAVIKTVSGGKPSEILFRYFQQVKPGTTHLSGMNLGWYGCDQIEDITQGEWNYPHTRLRRNVKHHCRFGIANAKGHNWVWGDYIQPAVKAGNVKVSRIAGYNGQIAEITEYRTKKSLALTTWTHENKYLPKGFIESILANQTTEYIQRYLFSSFEEWGGKIYKEFHSGSKHVIDAFEVPGDWETVVSIDVGGDSPWGITVNRFDTYYGDCFCTNEYYETTLLVDEIVAWLRDPDKSGIPDASSPSVRYVIDPQVKTVVAEFANRGIMCSAARKGPKLPGIMRVAGYMQPKKGRTRMIPQQPSPSGGFANVMVEDAPHFWVFRRCEHTIREHAGWNWERDKRTNMATDRPVDEDDHTCDSLIYALRERPEVQELPKVDPGLERLRRDHFKSYQVAVAGENERVSANRSTANGEEFMDEAGGLRNVEDERFDSPW